jgi:HAMP domain-containing protein
MAVTWRRKRVVVERGMQLRFARFVILYMLGCCVVTACIVFYATFSILGEKLAGIYPQNRLPEIFTQAYVAFFVSLLVAMPPLFYGALAFSHRIAGPLPKIYRALDEIGEGKFDGKLTLRKNDELKELAEHINRMAEKLQQRESRP